MPHKPLTRERVQRLAANPGERSKLPVSVLQKYGFGDLARKRLLQQRLDSFVVPGSQMTNRDLAHQAGALTTVQYGAPIQLAQRQAQQAPDYYAVYAKALRDSASAAQQQGVQSGQAIQGLYGSGPNAPDSPQSTIGQAQAGTAQLLGDAGRNYLNTLAAAAVGQGVQQRNQALQREADLRKEAGAFNVAQRGKLTSQELQNVSTAALAGVNAQRAQTAAQQGQERISVARQNARTAAQRASTTTSLEQQRLAETQRHNKAVENRPRAGRGAKGPAPTAGPGSLSPAEEAKRVAQVTRAAQYLNDLKVPAKDKNGNVVYQKAKNRGEVIAWLKAHGINPDLLGVADSLSANNLQGIGPKGVEHAHNAGLHIGGRWKVVSARRKPGAQQSPH